MVEVKLTFNKDEVLQIFQEAGLIVEFSDRKVNFRTHNDQVYTETIPVWQVTDPHTGKKHIANEMFEKYIEQRKKELFLSPAKLDIYKLFNI